MSVTRAGSKVMKEVEVVKEGEVQKIKVVKRKGKKAEEVNETLVVNVGVVEKIEGNTADMWLLRKSY